MSASPTDPDAVARERAAALEANAVYKAAQALAGHFGMRPWIDMAHDRGELRRKVRDKHFDPNEPTQDDCLLAFQDALKAYREHLERGA